VDTKAYIESGIIESYVLGLASVEEAAELEMFYTQHAAIKNAVDEFALMIERTALKMLLLPLLQQKKQLCLLLLMNFLREELLLQSFLCIRLFWKQKLEIFLR
jgi:hypothetical protein